MCGDGGARGSGMDYIISYFLPLAWFVSNFFETEASTKRQTAAATMAYFAAAGFHW